MPTIVSVGSGKGGVGKSVISSNIAYLLANSGHTVTLVDLDAGGADIHILMGEFQPRFSLTDFIEKKVATLDEVAQRLDGFARLRMIAGTGDSLQTANMPAATRAKLLRHLRRIESDIVVVDVGAGTHFNTLDFFLAGDIQIGVTTSDPTAILDLYRFIKLAVIRKALSSFLSQDTISQIIKKRDIKDIDELTSIAAEYGDDKRQAIDKSINELVLCIVFNQVTEIPTARFSRLQVLLQTYLRVKNLHLLGKIPEDQALRNSIGKYQPVSSLEPTAIASLALQAVCEQILIRIQEFQAKQML